MWVWLDSFLSGACVKKQDRLTNQRQAEEERQFSLADLTISRLAQLKIS